MNEIVNRSEIKPITIDGLVVERNVIADNRIYGSDLLFNLKKDYEPKEDETVMVRLDSKEPQDENIPIFVFNSQGYDEALQKITDYLDRVAITDSIFLKPTLKYYMVRIKTDRFNGLVADPTSISAQNEILRDTVLTYKKVLEKEI
jgi:hypothetical protein